MKSLDVEACVTFGVEACRLESETRPLDLCLPAFSWETLEAFAAHEDIPLELLIRHVLDEWVVAKVKSAQYLLPSLEFLQSSPSRERTQQLYFMRKGENGPIKIGVSFNVTRRRNELQNHQEERLNVLLAVEQRGEINERSLHKRFARHRKAGEWFEPCDELLQLIERLRHDQSQAQMDAAPEASGKGRT